MTQSIPRPTSEMTNRETAFVLELNSLSCKDLPLVGGKNSSLGEMLQQLTPKGINVPDGFAPRPMPTATLSKREILIPNCGGCLKALMSRM